MISTNSTRRLWVKQGQSTELFVQLANLVQHNKGDWITVTPHMTLPDYLPNSILPNKTRSLLGNEYRHAIFDATEGFNLDAFAILSGTLVKGSILILLLPDQFESWIDNDSLRWNEHATAISVPNFIRHLLRVIDEVGITNQHSHLLPIADSYLDLQEQQSLLPKLLNSKEQIMALIAKRGRGKSALAGLFSQHRHCWITAPNKQSLHTFFQFCKTTTPFYAPDELISGNIDRLPEYLIIDEAAMIPLPILETLLQLDCRILLTTTVEGYEGTGRGFLLKLLNQKNVDYFYLNTPIRWHAGDQIEYFTDRLLINDDDLISNTLPDINVAIDYSTPLRQDTDALIAIYRLLKIAHYRTSPTDLRRLFDAQNLLILQAKQGEKHVGALVGIYEGGLDDDLIESVWQGTRRPKGNLVAQSLVAHAGEKRAAKLRSIRINRIAVEQALRCQGIGKTLIRYQETFAKQQHIDFLSVSFAYHHDVYQFWQAYGFILVHVASHKEASSGSYSVMALYPMTEQGEHIVHHLHQKLQRNWYWLKTIIGLDLPIDIDTNQRLSEDDIQELSGFAHHHRPYEASYAALCRLIQHTAPSNRPFPLLSALIKQTKTEDQLIRDHHLSGYKSLLQSLRQEVIQWLADG